MNKLRSRIETAVLSRQIPGRSPFLLWGACLQKELDPCFAVDLEVVRHELWRRRRYFALPEPAFTKSCQRLAEVFEKWGWEDTEPHNPLGSIQTYQGKLDLAWEGKAAVDAAAYEGHLCSVYVCDKRGGRHEDLKEVYPLPVVHARWAQQWRDRRPACA